MKKIIKEKIELKNDQAIDALFKKKKAAVPKKERIVIKEREVDLIDRGMGIKGAETLQEELRKEFGDDAKSEPLKKMEIKSEEDMVRSAKRKELIMFILVVLCMASLSLTALYYYQQYRRVTVRVSNVPVNDEAAMKEAQSIQGKVGTFIELPKDEEPILATVTDVEKLKSQKFFANAQNGDKVLIYSNNKKAILYRPSIRKVIEFSIVSGLDEKTVSGEELTDIKTQDEEVKSEETQAEKNTPAKVAVYNGSAVKGLAQKTGDQIEEIEGMKVVAKTNAAGNYDKTIVIDISGSRGETAKMIAEKIGGEVAELPEKEKKPAEADILVICGSN